MFAYSILPDAEQDIDDILDWSFAQFGLAAQQRYEALIARAIQDIAEDPVRPGAHHRPELGQGVMTYHVHFSRTRVDRTVGRVKHARHFVVYWIEGRQIVIARVLHDGMDLDQFRFSD